MKVRLPGVRVSRTAWSHCLRAGNKPSRRLFMIKKNNTKVFISFSLVCWAKICFRERRPPRPPIFIEASSKKKDARCLFDFRYYPVCKKVRAEGLLAVGGFWRRWIPPSHGPRVGQEACARPIWWGVEAAASQRGTRCCVASIRCSAQTNSPTDALRDYSLCFLDKKKQKNNVTQRRGRSYISVALPFCWQAIIFSRGWVVIRLRILWLVFRSLTFCPSLFRQLRPPAGAKGQR